MQEPTRDRKLIAILKNGAVVFSEVCGSDLSVYCQNAFTGQLFPVVQAFKIAEKDKLIVSALTSENGKNISVLISYKNFSSTANSKKSDGIVYRFSWREGKIIGSIEKKKLYASNGNLLCDSLGNGGIFHSDSYSDRSFEKRSIFDVNSGKSKSIDLGGNISFARLVPHLWLDDGFFCVAMYKRKSSSFLNIGLGRSYLKLYDSKQEVVKPIMEIDLNNCVHAVALSPNKQFLAVHMSTMDSCDSHYDFDQNRGVGSVEIWSVALNKKLFEVNLLGDHTDEYSTKSKNYSSGTLSMAISNSGSLAVAYLYMGVEFLLTYSAHSKKINTLRIQDCSKHKIPILSCYRAGYFTEDENQFLFPFSKKIWRICKKDPMDGQWFVSNRSDIDQIKLNQNSRQSRIEREDAAQASPLFPRHLSMRNFPSGPVMGTQTVENIRHFAQQQPPPPPQNSTSNLPSAPVMGDQTAEDMARSALPGSTYFTKEQTEKIASMVEETINTFETMNANLGKIILRERDRTAKLRKKNWDVEMVEQLEACQNGNLDVPPIPEINCNELKFRKKLGRGGQGVVELCEWGAQPVAVKTMLCQLESGIPHNFSRQLQKEAFIMGCLNHPNIVDVLGYSLKRDESFSLVMQYYSNGPLSDYVYSPKEWSNSFIWRLRCAKEISDGLMYLHKYNLLHLDLKPENIFLDQDWHAVIGDFGISRALGSDRTHMTLPNVQGTVAFIPPELFVGLAVDMQSSYRASCDVYSFGMLLWCLMAQKRPFVGMNSLQIMQAVLNEGRREIIPDKLSPSVRKLIEKCWSPKFFERPDIDYVNSKLTTGYEARMKDKDGPVVFGAVPRK